VPLDHSCKKVRACHYEVVGIYSQPIDKAVEDMYDDVDDEEDQWDGDEEDDFYDGY
jgi:hypothetical protein